jgi:hypothetical protein
LVKQLVDQIVCINEEIPSGTISQEECIRLVREKVIAFEEKRVALTN